MKKITLIFLLFFANMALAQEKMTTNKGIVNFEASVPLFEEVKAKNENATCVLNLKNGEISSTVFIKFFRFKISLMEKHFNENYMESDHYPKATFKGKIEGFNLNIIGTSPKEFNLKGILKLHGKSKKINTVAILRKSNNGLEIITNFNVNTKDFNIKIPEILSMKIAETVNIKTAFWVE
ncbi:YceI family protein [Flavobacterium limnophilum]|uniref:YceI family protein n=1 Tax=Flavobacterium limnophilum TaxID=3003262 RepID=UPI002482E15D|nr:YceI family protein [Flavobacterium limnophilum]